MRRRDFGIGLLAAPALIRSARAEAGVVRISKQYGLGYMSMMVMEKQGLVEQHATRLGLAGLKVEWSVLGGPGPQIDALLAGQADFIGRAQPRWRRCGTRPPARRRRCAPCPRCSRCRS